MENRKNALPVLLPLLRRSNVWGDIPENATTILHHRGGPASQELHQEDEAANDAAHVWLVLPAVGRQVPQSWEDHFQSWFIMSRFHSWPHGCLHQGPGWHRHGRHRQHRHHSRLRENRLRRLISFPSQISEEVCGGFSQVFPVWVQLDNHDLHKAREGTEVGLDAGIPEGEVGKGHHSISPNLPALVAGPCGRVSPVLHLQITKYLPCYVGGRQMNIETHKSKIVGLLGKSFKKRNEFSIIVADTHKDQKVISSPL